MVKTKSTLKVLKVALEVLCYILIAWVVVSFFDVNAHNLTTFEYYDWNFFLWMERIFHLLPR